MSNPANLDEESSPAHCKCDLNQEKATDWGETFRSEGAERKPEEQHITMLPH